jgi:hypothetical protein
MRGARARATLQLPRGDDGGLGVGVDFTLGLATDDSGSDQGHDSQHDERLHDRVSFALRALKMVGLATDACNVRGGEKSCQLPIFAPTRDVGMIE